MNETIERIRTARVERQDAELSAICSCKNPAERRANTEAIHVLRSESGEYFCRIEHAFDDYYDQVITCDQDSRDISVARFTSMRIAEAHIDLLLHVYHREFNLMRLI